MNYIYNIKVNLKNKLYNFYEWDNNITYLDRVKIYIVSDEAYNDIINMRVKVENKFLNEIKISNKICLFTNDIDVVCVKFDDFGCIELISKLDLEDEIEVLDEIESRNKTNIKYEIINKSNNYSLNTNIENKNINLINEYLEKHKDDTETINYLYYELFNNTKCKNKYKKIVNEINKEYSINHDKLYNLIILLV